MVNICRNMAEATISLLASGTQTQTQTDGNGNTNTTANANTPPGGVYIMSIANTISSKQSLLIIPIVKYFNIPENLLYLIRVLNSEVFGTKSQTSGSPISLRLIDWFVTNYCKKNNIMYNIADYKEKNEKNKNKNTENTTSNSFDNYFFVHDNYKSQLKECSKKHFDPFCRRNRVRFYYKPNAYFKTTVGQLNFFKWALENYVIDYIRANLDDIEKDMNDCIVIAPASSEQRKLEKNTRKRTMSESVGATSIIKPNIPSGVPVASAPVNPIIAELAPKTKSQKKTSSRQKRKELSSSANKSFTKYSIPTTITFD